MLMEQIQKQEETISTLRDVVSELKSCGWCIQHVQIIKKLQ